MTIETERVLVYLGNIDERYPHKEQLEHCKKTVREHDLPDIGRRVYQPNELGELIENLRGSELVMLARLSMLAVNRERDIGNRFLMNLLKVTTRAQVIMDVSEGISSYEFDEWIKHVKTTRNKLVNSRPLSSKGAKIIRELRGPIGLENHWTEHVKKTDPERFERMAQHWRDPHKTAMEAIEQSPDEQLRHASRKMWERIFGRRT